MTFIFLVETDNKIIAIAVNVMPPIKKAVIAYLTMIA